MDMLDYIKRTANKNTIWIDTTGTGLALAEQLKAKGVPVNKFNCHDQQTLKQHLDCQEHESSQ